MALRIEQYLWSKIKKDQVGMMHSRRYSSSVLLYQDKPAYDTVFKTLVAIVPIALLVGSLHLSSSGDYTGSVELLLGAFFIGFLFWAILPRAYQIYEDHIRIVLGGPFSVKVGFNEIGEIRVTSKANLGISFASRLTRKHVEITRARKMSIAITPKEPDLFVENANQILRHRARAKKAEAML
jgi:hypothetical protein